MSNDPLRINELKNRFYHDDQFRWAYHQTDAPALMIGSIRARLFNGNIVAQICGPTSSAKSEVGQSLFLDYIAPIIRELGLRSTPNPVLRKLGIPGNLAITRNYAQSVTEISKMDGTGDILTVIEDEDEGITGEGKIALWDHYKNFLRQGRKTQHNLIKIDVTEDENLLPYTTFTLETMFIYPGKANIAMLKRSGYWIGPIAFRFHSNLPFREWYESEKTKEIHKVSSQGWARGTGAILDIPAISNKLLKATLTEFPDTTLLKDHLELVAIRDYSHLTGKNFSRAVNLAWAKYRVAWQPKPQESPAEKPSELDTKYSDEGFEENVLDTLPEFQDLWLDSLYFIPPRLNENGVKTDYPDVIGILKDGSIGLCNAKNWAWRNGDSIYVGGERGKQKKINAELRWCDKLQDLGFTEEKRIVVFAQHKVTKQIFVKEVLPENCKSGSLRVKLPALLPTATAENPPNLSSTPWKEAEKP